MNAEYHSKGPAVKVVMAEIITKYGFQPLYGGVLFSSSLHISLIIIIIIITSLSINPGDTVKYHLCHCGTQCLLSFTTRHRRERQIIKKE